jgi:ABC-type uncharacterized transport system substrate-binding protein
LVAASRQGLSETGYVEGQNVAIEYRWAEGHYARLPALAADLVSRKVDVIAGQSDASALAAKSATATIPIVFVVGADPVAAGLVASLPRPGANLTGIGLFTVELVAKRLELISELVPQARVIALLVNPNYSTTESIIRDVEEAARVKDVQLEIVNADTDAEIDAAFAALGQLHAGALIVGADPFFASRRQQLVALASRHAVPVMYFWREFAVVGGLISYAPSIADAHRPGRHLCRTDSQGGQTGRSAGAAAGDLRAGRQSHHRQDPRPYRPAVDPRSRQRGHRMTNST